MPTIAVHLDARTLAQAQRLAASRRCTVGQLLTALLAPLGVPEGTHDPFLGMVAQEPALVDHVLAVILRARAASAWRGADG